MLYFGGHVQWASFGELKVGSFMVFESASFWVLLFLVWKG